MPLQFVLNFQQKGREIPLNILLRNPQEMELIRRWYENTPREMLPEYQLPLAIGLRQDMSSYRTPSRLYFHRDYTNSKLSSGTNFIRIKEEKVEPRLLVGLGNHTPGDPNCPETWQGWKELEESLTPSTMRDEIRMTRIVIQYCDTEDSKVLDELTEWLQNMNAIQRVVMVQNVMNLQGKLSQDGEIRKPLNKLIETVQPFAAEELPAEISAETGK
ncbi:MAG: hypothetical protein PHE53_09585 [Thermoguttaceae bacterium]|nr:hypothetical protein [Thermoguttaceae bacterium]